MINKLKFIAMILAGILLSTNLLWADYTITFNTSGSVGIASGGDYVSSTSTTGYLNYTSNGMQFGSTGNSGAYEMTLTTSGTYIGSIKASKITIKDAFKTSSNGGPCKYTITYTDNTTTTDQVALSNSADDYDISLNSDKTLKKIKFFASASNKRFYVKSFTVVAASAKTCVFLNRPFLLAK